MLTYTWVICPRCEGKFDVNELEFNNMGRKILCPWCNTFFSEEESEEIWIAGIKTDNRGRP